MAASSVRPMTVASRFWAGVAAAHRIPGLDGPIAAGDRLAWAARRVLHGDGAGIALTARGALRVPWGASDPDATMAETLQFTAGQGPCFDAFTGQQAVMAGELVISRFWPGFAEQLLGRTPFRSVFAIPIRGIGVLDLYFGDPVGSLTVDVAAADEVAGEIWTALADEGSWLPTAPPSEITQPGLRARSQVPVAMGILVAALDLTGDDALAVLRAHAFADSRSVDDVAADVVDGTLDPHVFG